MIRIAILLLLTASSALAQVQAPPDEGVDTEPDPSAETAPVETDEEIPEDLEAVEADPDFEATVEDVFKPGDEISEDYPIPLPADI